MIKFAVNQQAGKKIPSRNWWQWLGNIEKAIKFKGKAEISIAVVGESAIKKLNRIYRGKNRTTDVLSFGESDIPVKFEFSDGNYLGEVVICYPAAVRQAKKAGHSANQELKLLLTHGFLHLLGYDHQKSRATEEMRALERKILAGK